MENCKRFILNGNIILIHKKIVKKIGILDGNFEHAFADIEYSLRAVRMGIKLFLTRKHIADCDRDMINNNFNLSIFEKLKNIFHIKQKPIKSIYRLYIN